jgi:hypothetical protein
MWFKRMFWEDAPDSASNQNTYPIATLAHLI